MRTLVTLSIFSWLFANVALAQNPLNERISITYSDVSTLQALDQLEKVLQWKFSFNPEKIPQKKINQTFTEEPLHDLLNVLIGADFECKSRGSFIILQHKNNHASEHNIEITGRVVDATTGDEIKNVSIYDARNLTASLTDQHGHYAFSVEKYDEYALVAISKQHYRDTIVRVDHVSKEPITFKLMPIENGFTEPPTDSLKRARIFKFLKNTAAREHDRNVSLHEERALQLSLVPVLGTNGILGGKVTNHFSLNLIAGYAQALHGVEIGGLVNIERENMNGVQLAGTMNFVGTDANGVQLSGISNTTLGNADGVLAAGVMNVVGSDANGVQLSGISNTTSGNADGVLAAGVINVVGDDANGVLVSGVMNSAGSGRGLQMAGVYNRTKNEMRGVQFSGIVNQTGKLHGVQIGLINFAKRMEKGSVMIGLLNFAGNGFKRFELQHNEITPYNLAFKSGVPHFYTIFSVGIKPFGDFRNWSQGVGIGTEQRLTDKWYLNVEGTYNIIQPLKRNVSGSNSDNRLALLIGYSFFKHLSINAGPVFHYYLYGSQPEDQPFFDSIGSDPIIRGHNNKGWIGYQIGVRF